jgi:hypothetical protein
MAREPELLGSRTIVVDGVEQVVHIFAPSRRNFRTWRQRIVKGPTASTINRRWSSENDFRRRAIQAGVPRS